MRLRDWSMLLVLILASSALAQGEAHVGYVYPAGGRVGSTFEVTVGGRNLSATGAYFSGAGVSGNILKLERQVTPAEQKELRETISRIQEKRRQGLPITPEEARQAEETRLKLNRFGRRLTNPSLGEFITMQVTVGATAARGNRELRLMTRSGLSNPMVFCVGDLPEISKADWKNVPKSRDSMDAEIDPRPPEVNMALPATINGQIPPGGTDRYRFRARKGQKVVVLARSRELIPFISDAVPGWFQATLALRDAKGEELTPAADYPFLANPVLCYDMPAAGEYVLEIRDSLYRGREDFVYRITAGELPYVGGVFPLGGRVGQQTTLAVTGWNLPFQQIPLDLRTKSPGMHLLALDGLANSIPLAADTLPECLQAGPNNSPETAQAVSLPIVINGRIGKPGEMNVYRFDGKAGERIVAEVYARRLGSPLDSVLIITDAAGKQSAYNDDHEDKASGLNTHHADSYIDYTLPMSGSYFVHIGDIQGGGGAAYGYRLRLSAPRPDFQLRITPSALNVRGGASAAATVHALRRDGFTGPISLRLKDAPPGFGLTAAQLAEGEDKVRFTLNAPPTAMEPFNLQVEGFATIQGAEVVRPAEPADDMMQAFAYHHLVPAQELKVAVVGRFRPGGDSAQVLTATPIQIPPGGTATVRVKMPVGPMASKLEYELSEPPEGITIKQSSPTEIVFQADAAKLKPGAKGNLIVTASAELPAPGGDPGQAVRRRAILGGLPAISYQISPR